jgi:hypothetical protein
MEYRYTFTNDRGEVTVSLHSVVSTTIEPDGMWKVTDGEHSGKAMVQDAAMLLFLAKRLACTEYLIDALRASPPSPGKGEP